MKKLFLGALLIPLAAVSARAQNMRGTIGSGSQDLGVVTERLHASIHSSLKNEDVAEKTYHLANEEIPRAVVGFSFRLHPWPEYAAPAQKDATIASIMEAGHDAIRLGHIVSEDDEINVAKARAEKMYAEGKINFGTLDENQAGVYNYKAALQELGKIEANQFFKILARLVPLELLYATIVHEARHAQDHQDGKLSPTEVKKGEISAFHTEWAYLSKISTDGKEIARLAQHLDELVKETRHHPIVVRADAYVWSLVFLYRTGGDDKKLMEFVDKMGYQEDGGRGKTSPFSS